MWERMKERLPVPCAACEQAEHQVQPGDGAGGAAELPGDGQRLPDGRPDVGGPHPRPCLDPGPSGLHRGTPLSLVKYSALQALRCLLYLS